MGYEIYEHQREALIKEGWAYKSDPDCEKFSKKWLSYTLEVCRPETSPTWNGLLLDPENLAIGPFQPVTEETPLQAAIALLVEVKDYFKFLIVGLDQTIRDLNKYLPNLTHIMSRGHLLCGIGDRPEDIPEGHNWLPYHYSLNLSPENDICPSCKHRAEMYQKAEMEWVNKETR